MSQQEVKLGKQGYGANAYKNAIDTTFTQLVPPPPPVPEVFTVEEFFELYTTLFYEIPATGEVNSHQYLIERSTEYIGFTEEKEQDIQVLLDEITQLREELLATQQELITTQNSASIQALENQQSQILPGTLITSTGTQVGGGVSSGGGSVGGSAGGGGGSAGGGGGY